MSALTRWEASGTGGEDGTATFSAAGAVLAVRLANFADAQALDKLIAAAEQLAGERARRACAVYLRGAVGHMETGQ